MSDLEKLAAEWLGDNLIIDDEAETPNAKARNWIFQLKRLLEKTLQQGRIEGLKEAAELAEAVIEMHGRQTATPERAIRARIQKLKGE